MFVLLCSFFLKRKYFKNFSSPALLSSYFWNIFSQGFFFLKVTLTKLSKIREHPDLTPSSVSLFLYKCIYQDLLELLVRVCLCVRPAELEGWPLHRVGPQHTLEGGCKWNLIFNYWEIDKCHTKHTPTDWWVLAENTCLSTWIWGWRCFVGFVYHDGYAGSNQPKRHFVCYKCPFCNYLLNLPT